MPRLPHSRFSLTPASRPIWPPSSESVKIPKLEEEQKAPASDGEATGEQAGKVEKEKKREEKKSRNFNIDALLLYGMYNRILWDASITQSFEDFTYQINSDFSRSSDFGYRNSGFHDNELGFTGTASSPTRGSSPRKSR